MLAFLTLGPNLPASSVFAAAAPNSGGDRLHAQPWGFGQSSDRDSALWHKGVGGDVISKNAKPRPKNTPGPDTTSGINEALNNAGKSDKKQGVGFSMKNESTSWKVAPQEKEMRPDEEYVREKRHVLRAYAGVEAADDFNISVGPELILKDEGHGEEAAKSDQPDSALGIGMQFKYDF